MNTPFSLYFLPKQGRWRGDYHFSITAWRVLLSAPIGLFARGSVISLAMLCKLPGSPLIETRVDTSRLAAGEVLHTTRISKWGLTLFHSVETFFVDADGRSLKVRGDNWSLPWRWIPRSYGESYGEIDEDGSCASYVFSWLGAPLRQRSTPEGERLRFTQDTAWSHAAFTLTRLTSI